MSVRLLQPAQAYAGFQFTHSATARNDGADEATGVVFTATAEPGLAILAAEAGASSCSVSPSSATCALGAIGGGASRGITLTLNAPDPGAFDLTAAVTADIDADPRRDSATVVVTAVRAVDLVWSAATAVVQVDAQTTVTATLQNAADFAASSVAVTATLSDGVRPDQATLGGTSCTISNQSITCPTQQQLAPRGTVDFRVVVTGRTAGSQRVTVAASSSDTERTPGDNQREVTVSVNSPQSSDGGGGALSWLAVAALLAACGFGRGRSSERHRPS
jgi:hypothetical protein